jgi:alpha-galactosidase
VEQRHKIAPCYLGDYYPLTSYSLDASAWMAWQFACPEWGEGMVQAFRRGQSPEDSIRVKLQGLSADAVYELTNFDSSGTTESTGRELCKNGLLIAIKDRPGAAVISYKKKP